MSSLRVRTGARITPRTSTMAFVRAAMLFACILQMEYPTVHANEIVDPSVAKNNMTTGLIAGFCAFAGIILFGICMWCICCTCCHDDKKRRILPENLRNVVEQALEDERKKKDGVTSIEPLK